MSKLNCRIYAIRQYHLYGRSPYANMHRGKHGEVGKAMQAFFKEKLRSEEYGKKRCE